jgi:hypothetical protein
MVTQFVAGIAGYRHPPTGMDPWVGFLVAASWAPC